VLKRGDYTLSGTPCTDADAADGSSDYLINITGNVGSELKLDVVYEQDPDNPYYVQYFQYQMYYDTNSSDGGSMELMTPTDITSPADDPCNPDPDGYFADTMNEAIPGLGLGTCDEGEDADGNVAVAQYYINFSDFAYPIGDTYPDDYPNFRLDQISMDPSGYSASDTANFTFSKSGARQTEISLKDMLDTGTECKIMQYSLPDDCGAGAFGLGFATSQARMSTRVTFAQPPCYVGTPSITTAATCQSTVSSGCTDGSAAKLTFGYGVPTTCYADSSCSSTSTDCGTYQVNISSGSGTGNVVKTATSNGTFDSTTDGDPVYVSSTSTYTFTLYGSDSTGGCLDSTNLSCSGSETGTVQTSTSCECGEPPVISSPQEPTSVLRETSFDITFTLTDNDSTIPSDIQSIYCYFTNDGGTTTYYSDVTSTLSGSGSSGTFTCSPDDDDLDDLVVADTTIWYGVIAQDSDGMEGVYGTDSGTGTKFSCTNNTTCAWAAGTYGDIGPVIEATSFEFMDSPYPNQFPFRASTDSVLKIFFRLSTEAEVTMRIYSLDGLLVRQIESSGDQVQETPNEECTGDECNFCNYDTGCQWDGTTYRGGNDLVTNGMYIVNIHAIAKSNSLFPGATLDYTKGIVVMK